MTITRHHIKTVLILIICLLPASAAFSYGSPSISFFSIEKYSNPFGRSPILEQSAKLSAEALSGESENIFLVVRNESNTVIENVSISLKKISGNTCGIKSEVFIIYPWFQYSQFTVNVMKSPAVYYYIPELMLKDDRDGLRPGILKNGQYTPPDIKTGGSGAMTDLNPGELKLLMINLSAAKDCPSGLHKFTLALSAADDTMASIDLDFEIYRQELPASSFIKGIYFKEQADEEHYKYIDIDEFEALLADVIDHGFNTVTIKDEMPEQIEKVMPLIRRSGIKGPVVLYGPRLLSDVPDLRGYAEKIKSIMDHHDMPFYIMGIDEPNSAIKYISHLERSRKFHEIGLRIFSAIDFETDWVLEKEDALEWSNLNLTESLHNKIASGSIFLKGIKTYYWQLYMEMPLINRLYSGFYLYYSGLDGIFPYVYRDKFPTADPYALDVFPFPEGSTVWYKNAYVTYPAKKGLVSTIQWEAMREGDDDLRYCILMKEKIEKLRGMGLAAEADRYATEFTSRLESLCGTFYPPNVLGGYFNYEQNLGRRIEELRKWLLLSFTEMDGLIQSATAGQ